MSHSKKNTQLIRWMTYLMFLMFAMTTDAVGVIIPTIIKEYGLTFSQAGMFHYAPMIAIALAGLLLGFLADKWGHKKTIVFGLSIFAVGSYFFAAGNSFYYFLSLLILTGIAIGVFKTGALALIGDISHSTREHTTNINGIEAFFGVGAIIGTVIAAEFIRRGVEWKWLYVAAGVLCTILVAMALMTDYPEYHTETKEKTSIFTSFKLLPNPYTLYFSALAFLYAATEAAIYVWAPAYLQQGVDSPGFLILYSVTIFFIFRAIGRFLGMWMMAHFNWSIVLLIFCTAIFICIFGSVYFGKEIAVYLLPLSGLFMSLVYPTINSKGISCFPKTQHGTIAGLLLFFTVLGAIVGPYVMGKISDHYGGMKYGFMFEAVLAGLLFLGILYNYLAKPVDARLAAMESEYNEVNT